MPRALKTKKTNREPKKLTEPQYLLRGRTEAPTIRRQGAFILSFFS